MFLYSSKMYTMLRQHDILSIPGTRYIRHFFSQIDFRPDSEKENKRYLELKFNGLREYEKRFVLMIDEIHIKAQVDMHLDYGFHGFDSDDGNIAKTVFAFMVKSIVGPYKEVVKLIPKFKNDGDKLVSYVYSVIDLIASIGGSVEFVVTDNNRLNIKMFKNMGFEKESVLCHYPDSDDNIFRGYDPVHILKNVRNILFNHKIIKFYESEPSGLVLKKLNCLIFLIYMKIQQVRP